MDYLVTRASALATFGEQKYETNTRYSRTKEAKIASRLKTTQCAGVCYGVMSAIAVMAMSLRGS